MKDYFPEQVSKTPRWLYIYLSIMLKFLTVFIFLYTFTEKDYKKVHIFKENFKKGIILLGKGSGGAESAAEVTGADPLETLVNQMKVEGINIKLMDKFLTLQQISSLHIKEGQSGEAAIIPDAILFTPKSIAIPEQSQDTLKKLAFLISNISYLVEINGYASSALPTGTVDSLELSAQRAMAVYRFFIEQGVHALKLKASGYGNAFNDQAANQDKIEIVFKSPEL